MENKQTAVEWAEDELSKLNSAVVNMEITTEEYHNQRVRLWEQAKEMHREQIQEAYVDGCVGQMYEVSSTYTSEQYYNATYANDTTKRLPEEDSKRRAWHY
jgi:predicted  nucleic acid-binding Zn-ribbon protein